MGVDRIYANAVDTVSMTLAAIAGPFRTTRPADEKVYTLLFSSQRDLDAGIEGTGQEICHRQRLLQLGVTLLNLCTNEYPLRGTEALAVGVWYEEVI